MLLRRVWEIGLESSRHMRPLRGLVQPPLLPPLEASDPARAKVRTLSQQINICGFEALSKILLALLASM